MVMAFEAFENGGTEVIVLDDPRAKEEEEPALTDPYGEASEAPEERFDKTAEEALEPPEEPPEERFEETAEEALEPPEAFDETAEKI